MGDRCTCADDLGHDSMSTRCRRCGFPWRQPAWPLAVLRELSEGPLPPPLPPGAERPLRVFDVDGEDRVPAPVDPLLDPMTVGDPEG